MGCTVELGASSNKAKGNAGQNGEHAEDAGRHVSFYSEPSSARILLLALFYRSAGGCSKISSYSKDTLLSLPLSNYSEK